MNSNMNSQRLELMKNALKKCKDAKSCVSLLVKLEKSSHLETQDFASLLR